MPVPRYAISYTPPPDSPLARFGAGVLGYDCFHQTEVPRRAIAGIAPEILVLATVEPRRHGFHAGLVAPFRLGEHDEDELVAALEAFARAHAPIPIGALAVGTIDRHIVLRPAEPHAALDEFAAACVEAFDPLRASLDAAERQERALPDLTARQTELLDRYDDPFVLDQFRFHMTLAGPIPVSERKDFKALMREAFTAFAADQMEIDAVSLLRQSGGADRFHVLDRRRLIGR